MRIFAALLLILAAMTGCQTPPAQQTLPTLAVLPSLTPTDDATMTPGPTHTATNLPDSTASSAVEITPSSTTTSTAFPTRTPPPTQTALPSSTPAPTQAPVVATVTPAGQTNSSTSQAVADLTITEAQFQDALNAQIAGSESIQAARVDFKPGSILVELTALGGEAFITGNVTLSVELSGSFIAISPVDIAINAPEPPEAYVEIVNGDFLGMILGTLDALLNEQLGPDHDLESLVLSDRTMEVRLLVPQ